MNRNLALLRDELEKVLIDLDVQQTQLRPKGDSARWSIQQIVGHLTLTYAATADAMGVRIAKGTATRAAPSVGQRVAQFGIVRLNYFPSGRKAPERVAPLDESALPGDLLIERVTDSLEKMDKGAGNAEAIFGCNQRSVSHMILGPMSVDQWRKFHLVHGRHHIKQITAIRREHGV